MELALYSAAEAQDPALTDPAVGVALCVACGFVGLFAHLRWKSGWGDGGVSEREAGPTGIFMVRLGFAALPMTLVLFGFALVILFAWIAMSTRSAVFGYLSLATAVLSVVCWILGVREFIRPSRRWRKWPEWIEDFDKDLNIHR
jgi:hypothetical protein